MRGHSSVRFRGVHVDRSLTVSRWYRRMHLPRTLMEMFEENISGALQMSMQRLLNCYQHYLKKTDTSIDIVLPAAIARTVACTAFT